MPRRQVLYPLESISVFTKQLTLAFEPSLGGPEPGPEIERSRSVSPVPPQQLPSVSMLPSPDILLRQPPYRLTMTGGMSELDITCSHSQSLVLLESYLRKWADVDHCPTSRPDLALHLIESSFGYGAYGGLTVTAQHKRVSPAAIAVIIERALGYELKSSSSGSWTFVRNVAFSS